MAKVEVRLERGDRYRLDKLHARVLEAVAASGISADVKKGTSAGGMTVHGEPEMSVGGKRVARPEAMTAEGMARLLAMAGDGGFARAPEPLALPFAARFRETGAHAEAGGAGIREVVDDATGVRYLLAGGSLCPLLHADGSPQRAV